MNLPLPTLQLTELSLEFFHPYNITLTPLVVFNNLSSTVHACEYMFNVIRLLLKTSIKYTHTDVSPSLTKTWGKCTKMLKYCFFIRQTSQYRLIQRSTYRTFDFCDIDFNAIFYCHPYRTYSLPYGIYSMPLAIPGRGGSRISISKNQKVLCVLR